MAPKPAGHCCEIVDNVVNSQVLDYVPLACENSERRELKLKVIGIVLRYSLRKQSENY